MSFFSFFRKTPLSKWMPPKILYNPMLFGRNWLHKRSGKHYQVVATGFIEANLTPCVIYQAKAGGVIWVRPYKEFVDGRFECLDGVDGLWPRDQVIKGIAK